MIYEKKPFVKKNTEKGKALKLRDQTACCFASTSRRLYLYPYVRRFAKK